MCSAAFKLSRQAAFCPHKAQAYRPEIMESELVCGDGNMNNMPQAPQMILEKIARKVSPMVAKRTARVSVDRPLVSITFDDCPKSVLTHALPLLEKEGMLATFYMSCGLCGTDNHFGRHMALSDIKPVFDSGHEIGDHTFSHVDANRTSIGDFNADIDRNQDTLAGLGVPPSRTFAYPFGQINPFLKHSLGNRFQGLRGIRRAIYHKVVDLNQIGSGKLYHGAGVKATLRQLKSLGENPGWVTLFSHDVSDTPTEFGCTPADLKAVIKALKDIDAEVVPVASALKKIGVADE